MTKRKRKEDEQSELRVSDTGLELPVTTIQGSGVSQTGSLPVGLPVPESGLADREGVPQVATSASYVGETPEPEEVANEATAATLRGEYGPFWSLLARARYTVW